VAEANSNGEALIVVKLHFRVIEKPNKNGGRVYVQEEVTLNFPKDLHDLLRFLRDQKIEIKGERDGQKVHLELWDKEDP
jgi:hypothetical protein